jgi:predicted nuclease of predicted toxin-antitoxin system
MRILLDECLPKKLKREFKDHEVKTVPEMGWNGKKNGELVLLAESQFDIFITTDQNLQYQQNLKSRTISIFVLKARDSRYETLKLLAPTVLSKITREVKRGIIEING